MKINHFLKKFNVINNTNKIKKKIKKFQFLVNKPKYLTRKQKNFAKIKKNGKVFIIIGNENKLYKLFSFFLVYDGHFVN
ncbi:MAG: hypothetical protein EAZ85_09450 [Bacteroidetes bacterium]|nr:MAG: hypothetical protein EAZ85_09450 [Bacteroidota bacterium]TAG88641.1 MAG: hypothetical protein EAZ20_08135 [Bacteroidota bacterium]